jgi:hypothetical protein
MCFSAAAGAGQHELCLKHGAGALDHPVEGGRHPGQDRVLDPALHVLDRGIGVQLEPMPVKVLGRASELHDEVSGKVLGSTSPASRATAAGARPRPHDDACVGAADEMPSTACLRAHMCLLPIYVGMKADWNFLRLVNRFLGVKSYWMTMHAHHRQ